MIKLTSIQKEGLLTLSGNLQTELASLNTEMDLVKIKLSVVENYDGLNFEGAANIIEQNIDNIINSLNDLSIQVQNYINEVESIDVYDGPEEENPGEEIIPPELDFPSIDQENPETTPEDETIASEETIPPEIDNPLTEQENPETTSEDEMSPSKEIISSEMDTPPTEQENLETK